METVRRWLCRMVPVVAVLALFPASAGVAAAAPPSGWQPCPDASGPNPAVCEDIQVPLSYGQPHERMISLHLSKLPALDPAHRIGVLLFNPGGPGGPGAETVAEAGRSLFDDQLQQHFDIIGFDPRGVGLSTALQCTGASLSAQLPVFPRSAADFTAIKRHSAAYAAGCAAKTTPGLLSHVDTVSAARDIDRVRQVLGRQRINYLGVSYGTYLGQTYARLFPHRLRAMVLDGAIDHAVGPRAFLWQEAASLSQVFGRFARWCGSSDSCALHGQSVTAVWDRLLARAERHPLPAPHAAAGPTTVSADAIRMVLPNLLLFGSSSFISTWPTLGRALAQAQNGDASVLADNSAAGAPQPAYTAVGCQDFPPQFHGYADAAARLGVARAISPHTGGASEAWEISDLCAGWPIRSADPWAYQPITDAPPILVASAAIDPSTPLVWAQGLHRQIAGSRLLIANVTGHTAFFNSACARNAETAYLISDTMPKSNRCGA